MTQRTPVDGPKLTFVGKFFILLLIAGSFAGAYYLFFMRGTGGGATGSGATGGSGVDARTSVEPGTGLPGTSVEFGIAYGTEKERWLKWAVDEFSRTGAGRGIKINLIGMGSLEGAQALLRDDAESKKIHVWSPASALYTDVFLSEWQMKFNRQPFVRAEQLALSPMVFVLWKERYDAFTPKYGEVTFKSVATAMKEPSGWAGIADKPDWGLFKFGHTHPNQSNSGLMTLVLLAHDLTGQTGELTMKDILQPGFQSGMTEIERAVRGLVKSTGTMMRDMVLRGPSSYDGLFVYESVVIDYLHNAENRWGPLHVIYPKTNMWNDNPYYIVDAPWSTPEQRKAADAFLEFLLSEPIQKQSLVHGFRPANVSVPVRFPDSPFVKFESSGLKIDIGTVVEAPKAQVINELLGSWQRSVGR